MNSDEGTDIGHGFFIRFFTEKAVEQYSGLLIHGPAAPNCAYKQYVDDIGFCGGGVHFTNSKIAQKEGRPMWNVVQEEPLTLNPSIKCKCGGQHGYIRNGRYEPC